MILVVVDNGLRSMIYTGIKISDNAKPLTIFGTWKPDYVQELKSNYRRAVNSNNQWNYRSAAFHDTFWFRVLFSRNKWLTGQDWCYNHTSIYSTRLNTWSIACLLGSSPREPNFSQSLGHFKANEAYSAKSQAMVCSRNRILGPLIRHFRNFRTQSTVATLDFEIFVLQPLVNARYVARDVRIFRHRWSDRIGPDRYLRLCETPSSYPVQTRSV